MSLMMDDVVYFITASETLNVTRASEKLGISQPTLSYSIKRLEKELKGQLFIRLKNGVQLTKLGKKFQTQARTLLFEWEKAQKISESYKNQISGSYSIGCHPSVAIYTLEHFLPDLNKNYEALNIELKHGLSREITEGVISFKIDFGIVVNPKPHPDLVIKELCKDEVSIFFKKGCGNLLIYDQALNQTKTLLKKFQKNRYGDMKSLTSENLEVVARLAHIGLGFGILPARVAKQYKNLQRDVQAPFFSDKVCLIYRVENVNDPSHLEIAKFILKRKNKF